MLIFIRPSPRRAFPHPWHCAEVGLLGVVNLPFSSDDGLIPTATIAQVA